MPTGIQIQRQNSYAPRSRRCIGHREAQSCGTGQFRRLLRLAGSRWRYSTPPPESESYVTTDGQSTSLSWYKAPIPGLRPDFYFRTECGIRLTVTFLIPWGALSDERTGEAIGFFNVHNTCSRTMAPRVDSAS
jgi:hypothetical protein